MRSPVAIRPRAKALIASYNSYKDMPFYVLKMGGSLMAHARDLMLALYALSRETYSFLVVPGGGPMADLTREIFEEYQLSQEAAHWMAILAMEQYAYFLADGTGALLTDEIERCEGLRVLLPYKPLLSEDAGLEHSWEYTSDSVAALVAQQLDAPFIKATDVDGVFLDGKVQSRVSAALLRDRQSCIDSGALRLLEGRSCWVLNGSSPEDFVLSIRSGRGGTVIVGQDVVPAREKDPG
jgi:aspartokinase-like uncharacterized kinase